MDWWNKNQPLSKWWRLWIENKEQLMSQTTSSVKGQHLPHRSFCSDVKLLKLKLRFSTVHCSHSLIVNLLFVSIIHFYSWKLAVQMQIILFHHLHQNFYCFVYKYKPFTIYSFDCIFLIIVCAWQAAPLCQSWTGGGGASWCWPYWKTFIWLNFTQSCSPKTAIELLSFHLYTIKEKKRNHPGLG